jgi:hypothetical protein
MVKWKIRAFGQSEDLALELKVNPSNYGRSKQVDVVYEQLVDGSACRIVSPLTFKKEEVQLVWANVDREQLDILMGWVGYVKPVVIKDHLGEIFTAWVDGLEKQYLISGTLEQRYAVNIKLREV